MDREGIRRLAAETLGLPTSPYRSAIRWPSCRRRSTRMARHRLPLHRQAGDEQFRQGPEQDRRPGRRAKAWDYAMAGGRVSHGRVIVEGFIDFDYEITQLTVRARAPGAGRDALLRPDRPCAGQRRLRGELAAHPMSPAALARSRQIAKAVTDNLGQGLNGSRPAWAVRRRAVRQGRQVWFSEVSPRPHDTGMVTMCTQWQNEFELHARAILGLPVDTSRCATRGPAR
jgi:phosphoribosylglycinamide formyltransferase 2